MLQSKLYNSQLFQIHINLLIQLGTFSFQFLDFRHYRFDVNRFFFLKGVHIARDIQVIIIVGYLLQRGKVTVFFYFLAVTVGFDYLLNVLQTELVLVLTFSNSLLASINRMLSSSLRHFFITRMQVGMLVP